MITYKRPSSVLLDSRYVIDGLPMELTPAQMLGDKDASILPSQVVDESLDRPVGTPDLDGAKTAAHLEAVKHTVRRMPLPYSGEYARSRVAKALLDAIWREGHFVLDDLSLDLRWRWKDCGVGSMAAFYQSVEQASDLSDSLDVPVGEFTLVEGEPEFSAFVDVPDDRDAVGSVAVPDPESWLIYIPFDTSDYRLGASLLSQAYGVSGGVAPKMEDPDYFIDCFEVVRELVEDRVVMAGVTVCDGGLMAALDRMASEGTGADVDLSDICRSAGGVEAVRVLFSEVPGVLIQIPDSDFDYVDAELLLQDVMYFPLGHPKPGNPEIRVHSSARTAIGSILESLIR